MKTFEELKESHDLKVKDWVSIELLHWQKPSGGYDHWRTDFYILRETEKAVQIEIDIESLDCEWEGTSKHWIPKSGFESRLEYEQREEERFQNGKDKYEKLINFCKENNVKGCRVGMRKDTLLCKIEDLGLKEKWLNENNNRLW